MDEINAVGHRMVHGGEKFSESVRLTPEVLAAFTACNDLAPLHNPANLKGVNAISAILPNVPQIGVFVRHGIQIGMLRHGLVESRKIGRASCRERVC